MLAWSKKSRAYGSPLTRFVVPNWSPITSSVVMFSVILFVCGCGSPTTQFPLFPQTKMDGNCFPKFAVSLPVFGPAGSIPRVDAASHPNLTVTMTEINQQVLPQGYYGTCGVN